MKDTIFPGEKSDLTLIDFTKMRLVPKFVWYCRSHVVDSLWIWCLVNGIYFAVVTK